MASRRLRWGAVGALAAMVASLAACEAVLGLGDLQDRPSGDDAGGVDGGAVDGSMADAGSRDDGASPVDARPDVGCPPGTVCNSACPDGGSTTISGTVYDPAARNPLYNVAVYVVPSTPLHPLPKGVGTVGCSCGALFPDPAVTSTFTDAHGHFVLQNVPAGSHVPLVIQIGKWRRLTFVDVAACQDNPQPDKSLALPSSVSSADPDDNMPDIAVSTGAADTLECLLARVGLPNNEYVPGASPGGHVHVFSGGGGAGGAGQPEQPPMPGAPSSYQALWSDPGQLMPYDVVLLSCEGAETALANPPALEQYLNVGGRVFASHFHYAWFNGPTETHQPYTAPPDWGLHLATWMPDQIPSSNNPIGGVINTSFPKGQALRDWLANVGALQEPVDAGPTGVDAAPPPPVVPAGELPIAQARFDAKIHGGNVAVPYILADNASPVPGAALYFSFDTPVTADAGQYCGRAVFSDLHVEGASTPDNPPPPGGCVRRDLSPQEKALEFMLFDLSACLTPWTP